MEAGKGAVSVDGEMVDEATNKMAQRIVVMYAGQVAEQQEVSARG